jgi:hypothetical protein
MNRRSERLGVMGQDPTRGTPQRSQAPMIELSTPTRLARGIGAHAPSSPPSSPSPRNVRLTAVFSVEDATAEDEEVHRSESDRGRVVDESDR